MSASQQHGFEIERIILLDVQRHSPLSKKVPLGSSHVSRFDIPGYSDPYGQGVPTSIKTAKKNAAGSALICMADATRIGELSKVPKMRLLVTLYEQKGGQKIFSECREYILTSSEWKKAMGGVSPETLRQFNEAIKLEDPKLARQEAKEWKEQLAIDHPSTLMRWNPKIDSKGQRRLQCSIHLHDLEALIKDPTRIRVFGDVPGAVSKRLWGNGAQFPIVINSPPRQRHKKPTDPASLLPVPKSSATKSGKGKSAAVSSKPRAPKR